VQKRAHRWCEIDPARTTDASRDDRCPPFGIGPCLSAKAMMTVLLFDVLDTGFGRRTVRCGIAP